MNKEIQGVPLGKLQDPIAVALEKYQNWSNGHISFDPDSAVNLELTPEKPNSARSVSVVKHLGETVGNLYIIAFAPSDGTGDHSTYMPGQIDLGDFPELARYYPRSKEATDTEVQFTIASQLIESQNDPLLFAGNLSVLGLVDGRIEDIGHLGQSRSFFDRSMKYQSVTPQTATTTVGYKNWQEPTLKQGVRFGDPHAIVNRTEDTIQVCGFIGISPTQAGKHRPMLSSLRPDDFT
jgi:hypothetical protein